MSNSFSFCTHCFLFYSSDCWNFTRECYLTSHCNFTDWRFI